MIPIGTPLQRRSFSSVDKFLGLFLLLLIASTVVPAASALSPAHPNGTTAATAPDVAKIAPTIVLTTSPDSPQTYSGSTTQLIGTLFDDEQTPAAGSTAIGKASFYNGRTLIGTAPLVRTVGSDGTNDSAALSLGNLTAGKYTFTVCFQGDATHGPATSLSVRFRVVAGTPAIGWKPDPAAIAYGTPLSAAQLDAVATSVTGETIPGSFTYSPALNTILRAGTHPVVATFTPTDPNYASTTATRNIVVAQATPAITWTPGTASIIAGTPLSSAQLDATATGLNGAALPGTFIYSPAAGTLLPAGSQTLKVVFSPTDLLDYTPATASIPIQVVAVALTFLSSTQATLGDPAKTITLTGTGFISNAVVRTNGSALPTTFVNPTTLTATIPATDFLVAQTIEIDVVEAAQNETTAPIAFIVGAPLANAVFSGPSTIQPGTDTDLTFKLTNPYPVDVTATFNVAFAPAAGLPADPGVLFTNGDSTYAVVIPANSTASPTVAIQGSTVAGSMTANLKLEAGGADVTPPTIQPLSIQAPLAVPEGRSVSFSPSGKMLTVVVRGLSDPRDMSSVKFHFTPASGGSIGTPDVTIDVVPIFTTWYADPASLQYGSTFTYTQTFNLSTDASVVAKVFVTLTNSVGESQEVASP